MRFVRACVFILVSWATSAAAQDKPIRIPTAPTEEPRYSGVDFSSWAITQALGTATEPISVGGDGAPICVGWQAIVATSAEARTCWCWAQTRSATVAAPTADGGCEVSDPGGADGVGACWTTAANETKWRSPWRPIVEARAGAHEGLCTVATSTTVGLGREVHYPCSTDAQCTALAGSGTCDLTTTAAERARNGCAFLLSRSAEATTAFVEGVR